MRSYRDYDNRTAIATLSGDPIYMDNLKTNKNQTQKDDKNTYEDMKNTTKTNTNVIVIVDVTSSKENTKTVNTSISNENDNLIVLDCDDYDENQQSADSSQSKNNEEALDKTSDVTGKIVTKNKHKHFDDINICDSQNNPSISDTNVKTNKSFIESDIVSGDKLLHSDENITHAEGNHDVVVVIEDDLERSGTCDKIASNENFNVISLDCDDDGNVQQTDKNKDVIVFETREINKIVEYNTQDDKTFENVVDKPALDRSNISRASSNHENDNEIITDDNETVSHPTDYKSNSNLTINEKSAASNEEIDENISSNTSNSSGNPTVQDRNVINNDGRNNENSPLMKDVEASSDNNENTNSGVVFISENDVATEALHDTIDLTIPNTSEIEASLQTPMEHSAKLTPAEVSKIRKIVFWLKKCFESAPSTNLSKKQKESLEWAKRNSWVKVGDIKTADHKLYASYIPLAQGADVRASNFRPTRLSRKQASKIRNAALMIQKYVRSLPAEAITDELEESFEWANRNANVQKNDIKTLDHSLSSNFSSLFNYAGKPNERVITAMAKPGTCLTSAEASEIRKNAFWLKYYFQAKDVAELSAKEIECFEWAKRNLRTKVGNSKTKDHIFMHTEKSVVVKAAFKQISLYNSKPPKSLTRLDKARLKWITEYISENNSDELNESEKKALEQSKALISDKPVRLEKRSASAMLNRSSPQGNETSPFVLQAPQKPQFKPQTIKRSPSTQSLPAPRTSTPHPQTSQTLPRYFAPETPLPSYQQFSQRNNSTFRYNFPAQNNSNLNYQTNLFTKQNPFLQRAGALSFTSELPTPSFRHNPSRQQSFNNTQPYANPEQNVATSSNTGIRIAQTVFGAARYRPTPERREFSCSRSQHSEQSFVHPSLKRQQTFDEIYRPNRNAPKRYRVRDSPAGYIVLAILDVGPGNGTTLPANWKQVQEALLNVYKDVLEANPGPPPICRELGWLKGRAKLVACADRRSVRLYKQAIQSLGEVWPGAKLRIVPKCQIASKPRSRAWIPAEPSCPKEILNLIRLSNPELSTQNWKVAKLGEVSSQRRQATIILNPQSLKTLLSTNGEVNYGFGSIFIKIYKDDLWMAFKTDNQSQSDIFAENIEEHKVFEDIIDLSYLSDSADSDLEIVDTQFYDDW